MTAVGKRGAIVLGGDYRGLGIVRSLGRRGIPVWVLHDADRIARFSRYTQHAESWPDTDEDSQVAHLLNLARAHQLDGWALFPTSEETAWLVSRHAERLERRFTLTTSPWDLYLSAVDKRCLYQHADALGLDTPRTWCPESVADLDGYDLPYPVVLKPAYRIEHNPFTDQKAWRIDNRAVLTREFARASGFVDQSLVMIQELIPGGGSEQYAFGAVCHDGDPLVSVTVRRARQYPVDFGRASTYVETVECPEVESAATILLARLKLTGMVEVEFKRDPRDGRYKLLDVNARAWGWHSVGAAAGVDFAALAWQLAYGEPIERKRGIPGVRWVRLIIDLPASVRELGPHPRSWGPYARSLRRPLEGPIRAPDDLVPAFTDVPLLASRFTKRIGRRLRQHFAGRR